MQRNYFTIIWSFKVMHFIRDIIKYIIRRIRGWLNKWLYNDWVLHGWNFHNIPRIHTTVLLFEIRIEALGFQYRLLVQFSRLFKEEFMKVPIVSYSLVRKYLVSFSYALAVRKIQLAIRNRIDFLSL